MKVIRILVYEGEPDFIEKGLARRTVKGSIKVPKGSISESFFYPGDAPAFEGEPPINYEQLLGSACRALLGDGKMPDDVMDWWLNISDKQEPLT